MIVGFGEGVMFPACNTLLAAWTPLKERSITATIVYSGMYEKPEINNNIEVICQNYQNFRSKWRKTRENFGIKRKFAQNIMKSKKLFEKSTRFQSFVNVFYFPGGMLGSIFWLFNIGNTDKSLWVDFCFLLVRWCIDCLVRYFCKYS